MGKVNQIIILDVLLIITLKNYWNELPLQNKNMMSCKLFGEFRRI